MADKKAKDQTEPESEMIIRLLTAKLRKNKTKAGEFNVCDVIFNEEVHSKAGADISEVTKTGAREVHASLAEAFKMLVPHFMILSEFRSISDFNKKYMDGKECLADLSLETFAVTGVHFKEKDGNPFAVLVGRKILRSNRVISMSLPMVGLTQTEEGYAYADVLSKRLDTLRSCVGEYMEGKFAPRVDLFNSGEGEQKMKVA